MAIHRLENNWTPIPNEVIDDLMGTVSGAAFKVFLFIFRKTIGWHKKVDTITISQIIEIANLSETTVKEAIRELESIDAISVQRGTGGRGLGNLYGINFKEGQISIPLQSKGVEIITPLPFKRVDIYTPQKTEDKDITKETPLSLFGASSKDRQLYPEGFQEFWKIYPRKKEKTKAFKMWKVAIRHGADTELLTRAARNYSAECESKGTSEDYIKHPATFLGPNDHWRDYLKTEIIPAEERSEKVQCQACGAKMVPAGSLCSLCRDPFDGGLARERERRRAAGTK
jgi:phage replication O-like protein O